METCRVDCGCPTRGFREEVLEQAILDSWVPIATSDKYRQMLRTQLELVERHDNENEDLRRAQLQAQLDALQERQTRLTDALIDGLIDKPTFEQRKRALLEEERSLRDSLETNGPDSEAAKRFIMETLELASTAQLSYEMGDVPARRELALKLCSNRTVAGKHVSVKPHPGLLHIAKREPLLQGALSRNRTYIISSARKYPIH